MLQVTLYAALYAHTKQDKNKKKRECASVASDSVWVCRCVAVFPLFAFVTPEVPRGQERILFLSRALFSYTRSPSFFIHSLLVPSLSFSAALNGPLSLMSD